MGCPHVNHLLKGHWDSTDFGVPGVGAHSLAPLWRMLVRDNDVLENPAFIFISFKSRSKPGASSELFPRVQGFGPVSTCSSQKNRKENPKESHRYHLLPQCAPGRAVGQIQRDKSCSTQLHAVTRLTRTRAQTLRSGTFPSASHGLLSNVLTARAGLTKSTGAWCGPQRGHLVWGTLKCFARDIHTPPPPLSPVLQERRAGGPWIVPPPLGVG